jgi:hypothetical protein
VLSGDGQAGPRRPSSLPPEWAVDRDNQEHPAQRKRANGRRVYWRWLLHLPPPHAGQFGLAGPMAPSGAGQLGATGAGWAAGSAGASWRDDRRQALSRPQPRAGQRAEKSRGRISLGRALASITIQHPAILRRPHRAAPAPYRRGQRTLAFAASASASASASDSSSARASSSA